VNAASCVARVSCEARVSFECIPHGAPPDRRGPTRHSHEAPPDRTRVRRYTHARTRTHTHAHTHTRAYTLLHTHTHSLMHTTKHATGFRARHESVCGPTRTRTHVHIHSFVVISWVYPSHATSLVASIRVTRPYISFDHISESHSHISTIIQGIHESVSAAGIRKVRERKRFSTWFYREIGREGGREIGGGEARGDVRYS
jgi:hypothetical protein